jgi:hypothetical protein
MSDPMDIEPLSGAQAMPGPARYRDSGPVGRNDVKS